MAIKAIFVGDEPTGPTRTPFRHAKCRERLQSWIDYLVGDDDYILVNQADFCNKCPDDCIELLLFAHPHVPVIALGNKASNCVAPCDHFKLPHPSGRNRQLNDKAKLWLKLRACKRYIDS